jgi:hypothetical protein
MSQTLAERLAEPDMQGIPDWQAATVLNAPDTSLPVIVDWQTTYVGPGSIMAVLGPTEGAALLDTIKASTDPVMRWGLQVVETGKLDIGLASTRAQIDALVVAGALTSAQRDTLFALSKTERYPSWAEFNNTFVDARSVGIARGGKP